MTPTAVATTKQAEITIDTDVTGRADAFNPAELFLAAVAACMIKGIERVTPMPKFEFRGVEVKLHGVRQDSPRKMISIDYEIILDTDEEDRRRALFQASISALQISSSSLKYRMLALVPSYLNDVDRLRSSRCASGLATLTLNVAETQQGYQSPCPQLHWRRPRKRASTTS